MSSPFRIPLSAALILACAAGCSTDAVSPLALGSVVLVSGDAQAGSPGVPLSDTLEVKVLDQTGRAGMSGVQVNWWVRAGQGTMDRASDTTDANGLARAVWTLGPVPGTNQATATVSDLPGVDFSATGAGLRATQVSLGVDYACALDPEGQAWCWGGGWDGELGTGITGQAVAQTYHPQQVIGGHQFVDLAAGFSTACGLDESGTAWCWGLNNAGQVGSAAPASTGTPTAVAGLPPLRALAQGGNSFTMCAIAADSTGYCWGDNTHGGLGAGTVGGASAVPQAVAGGLRFRSITLGGGFGCGVAADGTAWCWGSGGGLGTGASTDSGAPAAVSGGYHYTALTAGANYTCGRTVEIGSVCWGSVSTALNTTAAWSTPTHAPGLDGLSEYAPGAGMGGAVRGNRGMMAFGVNSISDAGAPLPLHAVRASDTNACGLAADGSVYCWGWNDAGQLGNPDHYGYEPAFQTAQIVVSPDTSFELTQTSVGSTKRP